MKIIMTAKVTDDGFQNSAATVSAIADAIDDLLSDYGLYAKVEGPWFTFAIKHEDD